MGNICDRISCPFLQIQQIIPIFTSYIEKNYLYNQEQFVPFINYSFYRNYINADGETHQRISESPELKQMGVWPASDSIQMIDDVIVIKISENY